MAILIFMKKEGFEGAKNGEPHVFSSGDVAKMILPAVFILLLWIWFVLRFWFLKTNDFICKYCQKECGGSFETRKNVCKTCYEKRKR